MNRLEKSIESLLENYESHGMVNHSGSINLPGRESIDNIVRGLEELLFPGYLENLDTGKQSLKIFTVEKINNFS